MNDTYVTFQGWVGSEVTVKEVGTTTVATFRVGSTPRNFRQGSFRDGETAWFTVNAWRTLARHVHESVRIGDAVVVHGRLLADVWERDGQRTTAYVVDASFVGHDLNRGTSTFLKAVRNDRAESADEVAVKELNHAYAATGPRLDSQGEPVETDAA